MPARCFAPNPPASTAEMLKLAEMQTQADGDVEKARVQLDTAKIALERAEKLVRSETGSQRALDDARAALRLAETTFANAQLRRELLGEPVSRTASLDRLWVRVPVYVGDLASLDAAKEIRIGGLGDRPGSPTRPARFAAGPPSANPGAASVDWFYEFENKDHSLRLGQRVGVTLPLRGEEESLVVPWAAVLHDVHGGQWVYENTAPQTFVRRRVQVARVEGDRAILASGPKPGAKVVTDGAAELFGTEFGAGTLSERSRHAQSHRHLVAANARARRGAGGDADVHRHPHRPTRAARCLSRIRAAARRDPDRGARPVHRGSGCARHRAAGELAQRPALAQDHPLQIRARPVVGGA